MDSILSSIGSDVTSLSSTANSLLPVATGVNNLINGTPSAATTQSVAASTTTSTNWIVWAAVGVGAIVLLVLFGGKK